MKRVKCPRCDGAGTLPEASTLRRDRLAAGITLREVARKMGVSAMYPCDIEKGRRNITGKLETKFYNVVGFR